MPRADHKQYVELEVEEGQGPNFPQNEEGLDDEYVLTQMQSQNAKKLLLALNSSVFEETTEELDGFSIVDMQLLANAIFQAAVCKHCRKGSLTLKKGGKHGLALNLTLECSNVNCNHKESFFTSKRCSNDSKEVPKQGGTPFEVNQRMVLAMRLLGKGLDAL